MNNKMKRFWVIAACIAVVGSTSDCSFSETINTTRGTADGTTGILTIYDGSSGSSEYTWDSSSESVTLEMAGGSLSISGYTTDSINGAISALAGNINLTGGAFTIGPTSQIAQSVNLNLANDTTFAVTGGSAVLDSATDTINGHISVSGGTLTLDSANKLAASTFTQTNGTTTVSGTGFSLNNSSDSISSGNLNIGNGTTSGQLDVSAGRIEQGANTNIAQNGTLNISGGNVALDNTDTWSGTTNVSGGSLALVGINKNSSGKFTQTSGSTTITGDFNMNNSSDTISGGDLNIGDGNSAGNLNVSDGIIYEGANVDLTDSSSINIRGGNVTLDSATDNWDGTVTMSKGTLNLNNMSKNPNGTYSQTGGTVNISGSGFDMNNTADTITSGTVNVGSASNSGKLTVSRGTIDENAVINVSSNGEVNVTKGNVTFDSEDTWEGKVGLNGSGTININNATKTGTLTQTDGTINVTGNKFDLNNENDYIDGGILNVGNGTTSTKLNVSKGTITSESTVTLNNKGTIDISGGNVTMDSDDTWGGTIHMSDGNLAVNGINKTGTLKQEGGITTVTGSGFDLNNANDRITGGKVNVGDGISSSTMDVSQGAISKDVTVDITKNATLNVNGGNVELGTSTNWTGNVNVTDGKLTLDNVHKNFDGVFNQSDGTTIVVGSGFDMDNSADIISGGTLHIGDKTSESDMSVTQGNIESNATVNINRNGTLNITGGTVNLDENDSWQGDVNVTEGNLNLSNTNKHSSGKFNQTGGKTSIDGNFELNNKDDSISGGNLIIGENGESTVTVSKGSIHSGANVTLNANSSINVTGGNMSMDNIDKWDGSINVTEGTLNVSNVNNKTGILTQTGGNTLVTGEGFDLNNVSDNISGGNLQIGDGTIKSDISISQGTIGANTNITINENAGMHVTGGNVNLDNTQKHEGGVFSQNAGTTTITGNTFDLNNSADTISGGNLNIGNGTKPTSVTVSKGTINSEAITTIHSNASLNVAGGNVNLDSGDSWNGTVNVGSGNLALIGIEKNTSGKFIQTGGNTTVTGDTFDLNNSEDLISDGTFNIGTASENSTVTVSSGTIGQQASTNIAAGSNLNITGGHVTLDGTTDKFEGNVNVTGGNLHLNGMNKNQSGILTQTGSTTTVTGTGSTLNNSSDSISGGNLNIGSEDTNGELDIEQGNIASNAAVNIHQNGTLNIKGGTAELDGVNDKWNGKVNVSKGTLNLSGNLNKATTSTATFNQTGGTTNINDAKLSLNTADSKITGGTVNIANTGELEINNSSDNASEVNSTGGKFSIRRGSKHSVTGGTVDAASTVTVDKGGTLEVNGSNANVTLDGDNDKFDGHAKVTNGILNLTNRIHKTTTEDGSFSQSGGTTNISGNSSLSVQDSQSSITGGEINVSDQSNLEINNGKSHSSRLNVSGSTFGLKGKSIFTTKGGTIDADSTVTVEAGSKLGISGEDANVSLNRNDKWDGSIGLDKGNLYISEDLTKVTDSNGHYIQTGGNLSMTGASLALADEKSKISGGNVNLTNNSALTVTKDGGASITGGNIAIDDSSVLNYLAQKGLIKYSDGNQINIDTSGLINMANNVRTNNSINSLTINNGALGDGQADFAIDLYARSNGNANSDTISADSIKVATAGETGTIRISDWNIAGDVFGYEAPIEKHIRLGKIFKSDNIDSEVTFTATDKEIFTPIGYYRLNASGANDGSYSLDLTRFNPQVFRGQVATAASYMNQLVINDTLFNRAQIRRYGASYDQLFKNKTAILDGTASYERTLKDGGLWTEVFGNFETLKMNNGLDKVRNNSWGFIVGADFGMKELRNGWTYIPTAYIAYNGGHQTFNGVGIWENGGQLGFMSSWMKKQFMETAMIYAGVYGTEMNIAGTSEDAFNYFVGVASKTAYDWNLGNHFVIQPSLTLAYNMFGQQNWHTDYGQMGMSSGFLNGFNVAPGVNFIYQRETWKAYATIAYAWNFFAGIDGQAGYVDLPSIKMSHGYLQYGFGMSKTFSDRLMMYAQATVRNVGRTGIICQGGLNWRL